jgi:hypothetical protein
LTGFFNRNQIIARPGLLRAVGGSIENRSRLLQGLSLL